MGKTLTLREVQQVKDLLISNEPDNWNAAEQLLEQLPREQQNTSGILFACGFFAPDRKQRKRITDIIQKTAPDLWFQTEETLKGFEWSLQRGMFDPHWTTVSKLVPMQDQETMFAFREIMGSQHFDRESFGNAMLDMYDGNEEALRWVEPMLVGVNAYPLSRFRKRFYQVDFELEYSDEQFDFSGSYKPKTKQVSALFLLTRFADARMRLGFFEDLEHIEYLNAAIRRSPRNFPLELCFFHKLEYLRLRILHCSYLPKQIGNWTNLRHADLSLCSFNHEDAIPQEIANWTKLEKLDISKNPFQAFPKVILQLSSLRMLAMNDCCLNEIPDELSKLTKLEVLSMQNNEELKFPDIFDQLPQLKHIQLNTNQLQPLPPSFAKRQFPPANEKKRRN